MVSEGVIQFTFELQPGAAATEIEAAELVYWRQKMFALDVIGCNMSRYGACYGNMSVRTGAWAAGPGRREFLVSGTQTGSMPDITADNLVRVLQYDHKTNRVIAQGPCEPSSETMTHGAIYDASLSIRAIVHGHDPILWQWILKNSGPHTPYDVDYGTPEMASHAKRIVSVMESTQCDYPGVLAMAGHKDGVVAFGSSVREATQRFLQAHDRACEST